MPVTVGLCKKFGIEFIKGEMGYRENNDDMEVKYFAWREGPIPEELKVVDVAMRCQMGFKTCEVSSLRLTKNRLWRPSKGGSWRPNMSALEMLDRIQELYSDDADEGQFMDYKKTADYIRRNAQSDFNFTTTKEVEPVITNSKVEFTDEEEEVKELAKTLNVDLKELANKL